MNIKPNFIHNLFKGSSISDFVKVMINKIKDKQLKKYNAIFSSFM